MIDLAQKGEWPPLDPDLIPEWYFWHLTSRANPILEQSVRDYLDANSIALSPNSLIRLIREAQVYRAERAAHRHAVGNLLDRIEEYDLDPQQITTPSPIADKPERFRDLIPRWARERKVTPKSEDEFTSKITKLTAFLGHDDATD